MTEFAWLALLQVICLDGISRSMTDKGCAGNMLVAALTWWKFYVWLFLLILFDFGEPLLGENRLLVLGVLVFFVYMTEILELSLAKPGYSVDAMVMSVSVMTELVTEYIWGEMSVNLYYAVKMCRRNKRAIFVVILQLINYGVTSLLFPLVKMPSDVDSAHELACSLFSSKLSANASVQVSGKIQLQCDGKIFLESVNTAVSTSCAFEQVNFVYCKTTTNFGDWI